jgi:hypothetical protein
LFHPIRVKLPIFFIDEQPFKLILETTARNDFGTRSKRLLEVNGVPLADV